MRKLFQNCHYWNSVTCYPQRDSWKTLFPILDVVLSEGEIYEKAAFIKVFLTI